MDVRTKGEWVKDNSEVFIRMINDMLLLLLERGNKKRKVERMMGCVLERVSSRC